MLVKSACGAAKLLAAISGERLDKVKGQLGLQPMPLCPRCGQEVWKLGDFCSLACKKIHKKNQRQVWVECSECGELFLRATYLLKFQIGRQGYQHTFCNRHCQGKWLGRTHGSLAHPENLRLGGRPRKHNWDEVWAWHRLTGWSSYRLGKALGIPHPTVFAILKKMGATNAGQL